MKIAYFLFLALLSPNLVWAGLSIRKLELAQAASESAGTTAAREAFKNEAKAFSEAIAFSTLQSEGRVKLAGAFEPYANLGFHVFRVDNEILRNFTDTASGSTPDFFHGLYVKGGTALPFGLNVEAGFSQVVSAHRSTGVFASLSGQVLDFANLVYIDLVPSLTLTGTALRTVSGPALYSFTGQTVIGAYHRQTLSQFGLIVQYSYTLLVALDPAIGNQFMRYGVMSNLPIYKGLSLRTEIFYPSVSGNLSLGYQF